MEYETYVPSLREDEAIILIKISKIGGGDTDATYVGGWEYEVYIDGQLMAAGDDLYCGTLKSHEDIARVLAGFLADDPLFDTVQDRFYLFSDPISELEEIQEIEEI